jgi:hypothetical protein
MAILGTVYWQHTGARAVPGLAKMLRAEMCRRGLGILMFR